MADDGVVVVVVVIRGEQGRGAGANRNTLSTCSMAQFERCTQMKLSNHLHGRIQHPSYDKVCRELQGEEPPYFMPLNDSSSLRRLQKTES